MSALQRRAVFFGVVEGQASEVFSISEDAFEDWYGNGEIHNELANLEFGRSTPNHVSKHWVHRVFQLLSDDDSEESEEWRAGFKALSTFDSVFYEGRPT